MNRFTKLAAAAALSAGAFALTTGTASAAIVCNDNGDCWHVSDQYTYPSESRTVIHEDTWKWGDSDAARYRWREHNGRGYWHGDAWVGF